jgi:hypothetical protein
MIKFSEPAIEVYKTASAALPEVIEPETIIPIFYGKTKTKRCFSYQAY